MPLHASGDTPCLGEEVARVCYSGQKTEPLENTEPPAGWTKETRITTGVTASRLVRTAASQVEHIGVSVYAPQRGCLLMARKGWLLTLTSRMHERTADTRRDFVPHSSQISLAVCVQFRVVVGRC